MCAESQVPETWEGGPLAPVDPVVLGSTRVLENLVRLQPSSRAPQDYCAHIQRDVQPYMRKVVTRWMLDVSTGGMSWYCRDEMVLYGRWYSVLQLYYRG